MESVPVIHQSDKTVAYYAHPSGRLILAPDTRMSPQQAGLDANWRRCEAVGVREIEKISLILSRQAFEEKKARTVMQHLREKEFIDQVKIRCKLRIAQAFSKNDASINQQIYRKIEAREDQLYRLIASEFDYSARNTALDVELHEQPNLPHHLGKKPAGVHA